VKAQLPFFGHEELRGHALQGQVKAQQRFVHGPGWLTVKQLQHARER